ncbi:metallophosphoesterase [Alkaliphilus pronyensis]|uniref:Phosphoesterase n=1 Tax=Alkaliphilus pronyensis TaxID=1482732 RepID=A0A6I0EY88_9FIRM|nr:metallophosphoesterase [Alkaliphilus pronyensis]KAB3529615.1 metallophosphoesterase [Alkaliphilus pronyensis]
MKKTVLVMGDTHSQFEATEAINKHMKDVDLILHTGDNYKDINHIEGLYNIKIIGVKGNCDWYGKDEEIVLINDKKIFICHGHQYNVKTSLNNIFYKGKEINADVVIFGHTHVPYYIKEKDLIVLNPGSLSFPRNGYPKSFAILEIDKSIEVEFISL